MNRSQSIIVHIDPPSGPKLSLIGREAWAVSELMRAGSNGCTPIDQPGPRWSGYVHKLRRLGLDIETIYERHTGPFAGTHARYVLRSSVEVIENNDSMEAA